MEWDDLPSLRERLRRGDSTLYYVPVLNHPISINEFHAHVLGFVTGLFVAVAFSAGYESVAVASSSFLIFYAVFGEPRFRSCSHERPDYAQKVGLRTIRWEPWHYLGLFLLGNVVVYLVG